ncbi:MAG: hypothetical protein WAU07_02045 [Microgenomates group bacterium]
MSTNQKEQEPTSVNANVDELPQEMLDEDIIFLVIQAATEQLEKLITLQERSIPNYYIASQILDTITAILKPFDNRIFFNNRKISFTSVLLDGAQTLSKGKKHFTISLYQTNELELSSTANNFLNRKTPIQILSKNNNGFVYKARFYILFKPGNEFEPANYRIAYIITAAEPDATPEKSDVLVLDASLDVPDGVDREQEEV